MSQDDVEGIVPPDELIQEADAAALPVQQLGVRRVKLQIRDHRNPLAVRGQARDKVVLRWRRGLDIWGEGGGGGGGERKRERERERERE